MLPLHQFEKHSLVLASNLVQPYNRRFLLAMYSKVFFLPHYMPVFCTFSTFLSQQVVLGDDVCTNQRNMLYSNRFAIDVYVIVQNRHLYDQHCTQRKKQMLLKIFRFNEAPQYNHKNTLRPLLKSWDGDQLLIFVTELYTILTKYALTFKTSSRTAACIFLEP